MHQAMCLLLIYSGYVARGLQNDTPQTRHLLKLVGVPYRTTWDGVVISQGDLKGGKGRKEKEGRKIKAKIKQGRVKKEESKGGKGGKGWKGYRELGKGTGVGERSRGEGRERKKGEGRKACF